MKRLFLVLLIPFIIGIYISYCVEVDITSISIIVVLLVAGLTMSIITNRAYSLVLLFLFFFIGMLMTEKSLDKNLIGFTDKSITLEGTIENRSIINEEKSIYIVKVINLYSDKSVYEIKDEKVLINYYNKGTLAIGDKIRAKGVLLLPRENTNPRLFNYRLYLQTKDIHAILNTDSNSLITISKGELNRGDILRRNFHTRIIDILDNVLSEKNSSLMKSVLLGDKSFLDDDTQSRLRDLGISHILAVSGLHIGIIYLFVSGILRLLGLHKKISVCFALILVWTYGFLIYFPTSVLRTLIMFSLLSLSTLIYRRSDSINTLSFAAIVLLFFRPLWIFDIGFQLSFISTASILIFTPRIKDLLSIYNKRIAKLLSPLIAVQIGIFPILAHHFNTYALLSIFSNLILIPIFSISLILCFILIPIHLISIEITVALGSLLNLTLNLQDFIINILDKVPFMNLLLPSSGVISILSYYLLFLVSLRIINIRLFPSKINKIVFNYLIFVLLISMAFIIVSNETVLEFIDVGQGDSCLVRTKNEVFLIDTGGSVFGDFDVGEMILVPYLIKKGINKIDAVFITHFHEDHSKGMIPLMKNIKIDNIFIGYENLGSDIFNEISYLAGIYNISVYKILENDIIHFDENNIIKVLNPSYDMTINNIQNENDLSLVLLLESHKKKILFTGDIEKDIEYKMVNNHYIDNVDIIKVPHHGSKTSSTLELISLARPSYAVIQVGKNNFGHPADEIIERYESFGTSILRNDKNGLITFILSKNNIEIKTFIKDKSTLNDIIVNYRDRILYLCLYIFGLIILCIIYKNSNDSRNTLLEE